MSNVTRQHGALNNDDIVRWCVIALHYRYGVNCVNIILCNAIKFVL